MLVCVQETKLNSTPIFFMIAFSINFLKSPWSAYPVTVLRTRITHVQCLTQVGALQMLLHCQEGPSWSSMLLPSKTWSLSSPGLAVLHWSTKRHSPITWERNQVTLTVERKISEMQPLRQPFPFSDNHNPPKSQGVPLFLNRWAPSHQAPSSSCSCRHYSCRLALQPGGG